MNNNKKDYNKKNNNQKSSLEKMKYEIANEFGVNLGPNASSYSNGKVGGEITKRLVEKGLNNKKSK